MEKKLQETVEALRARYPDAELSIWAEDEHRIGLHPVNRRIWALRGTTPTASVNWKFKWSWLAGFVEPHSGQTYWWIVPRVNWQIFERMLADFATHFEIGPNKRVLLVIDQAAFHTTSKLTVPEGIHFLCLPPKSPELQPAERLWPIVNEAIANQSFESLDAVEDALAHRCRILIDRPEFVQGVTHFHWWADAVA